MKTFVVLLFIIILAFFLRSYTFFHGDFFYSVDQSRDLLLAKGIVFDHKLTLIGGRTGFGGLFHGALWIYLITPFMLIAKGNPFWSLIPLFEIVNLGTIVAGFYIGNKLYGKTTGLLLAFFLTVSSSLVSASVSTTNAEILPLIVLFYLLSIIQFLRGKEKYFVLTLFLVGLGFQFESAFAVLLIPLTLFVLILKKKLPALKTWFSGVIGFLIAVSTFILFDLRHNFLMTSSVLRLFTNTQKPLPGYEQYANLGFRILDRISNWWGSLFAPLYSNNIVPQLLLIFFIALAFLLVLNKFRMRKAENFEKEFLFVFFSPIIIFGIYILYPYPLWSHYLLPVTVFSSLSLVLSLKLLWQRPIIKPIILLFLILAFVSPLFYLNTYFSKSNYTTDSDGSYINQLKVAQWVFNDSQNRTSGYFVFTPGILTYNMDYLLWWIAKNSNVTKLQNIKTKNTYLIMYPPVAKDYNAHNFWKKNVIHTESKPSISKTFQGDIIVEKVDLSNDSKLVDPNYFQNLIFR